MWTGILGAGDSGGVIAVDLFLILSVAGLVALIMQRMRMALIPAYLIAGAVIGPNVPWTFITTPESLAHVAQLAIVLLLFGIGLEMDISILRRGLGRMITIGVGACALTILLGYPVALLFGLSHPAALVMCMAFSLSSTAVVLRIIAARHELRRRSGRLAFAVLVIQDVIVLAMLAVLPLLARWAGDVAEPSEPLTWFDYFTDACLMIGGVVALVVASKTFLPKLLRESLRGRRLEVMMLIGISAALGAAVVAQAIGFSFEMGAFLAGFILAGTPFRHQLSGQIGPLRDIFSALFFTTVGMKVDPSVLVENWWIILVAVALVATIKCLVIGGLSWTIGALASTAIVVGFSLAQAGEFSLILIGEASDLGILNSTVTASGITIVVISLILTPGLADIGRRLARRTKVGHAPWVKSRVFGEVEEVQERSDHVIIGGFGPVGRRIAIELERTGVSFTLIELNPDTVVEQIRERRSIVFGDVANLSVLESAGIGHAAALILTVPDEEAVIRACAVARRRSPKLFIAARTGLLSKSALATNIGADHVVVDELAAAEAMVAVIKEHLGLPAPTKETDPEVERDEDIAEDIAEVTAEEAAAEADAEPQEPEAAEEIPPAAQSVPDPGT